MTPDERHERAAHDGTAAVPGRPERSGRSGRGSPPEHRAQRLFIAGGVLAAATVVVVVTWLFVPRPAPRVALEHTEASPPQAAPVELYFAAVDGAALLPESRVVALPENSAERARVLVHELAAGPTSGGQGLIPAATTVRAAYLLQDGELLCLDMSRDLRTGLNAGSTAEHLALEALLRTVAANVPGVKRVQILLEGQIVESLAGHEVLSRPLELDEWKEAAP